MKWKETFSSILFIESSEVSDETVEYYRQNPDELNLIIDKDHFQIRFLAFVFFLGSGLTVLARTIKYFFAADLGEFVNDVILDLASELGIAIFGGAVTAYFLEFLHKRQYEENVKFRNRIKARLEEEGN